MSPNAHASAAIPAWRTVSALRWFFLAIALAGTAACADSPTSPIREPVRIAVDLSALVGGQQAGGRVSFLQEVRLLVTVDDSTFTLVYQLAPADSTATFDVTVPPGPVTFDVQVFSNAGALVYAGRSTGNIQEDDFVVTITVAAVNGVMVVSPDTAGAVPVLAGAPFATGRLVVRNVGNQPLTWSGVSILPQTAFSCFVRQRRLDCRDLLLPPGAQDTAEFFFDIPSAPTVYAITFASSLGTVVAWMRFPSGVADRQIWTTAMATVRRQAADRAIGAHSLPPDPVIMIRSTVPR